MALHNVDYNTRIKDILWDDSTGAPMMVEFDARIATNLIEILWVVTGISKLVGRPNLAVLKRVQEYASQALTILRNRQATQTGLEPREQVVNFDISQAQLVRGTPTSIEWVADIRFRDGNQVSMTIP